MRYLITGATGFIGPHLIRRLTTLGHHCRCLVRTGSDTAALQGFAVEFVTGDVTDKGSLSGVADGMDVLVHMATLGHMSNFIVDESCFEAVNVQGTLNIMQAALDAGVKKIVHCSSVAAMGICTDVPATEQSDCRPHHPYGRSKLKAEKEVLRMVRNEALLPAVIVRFSMVYGPGDHRDILKLARLAKKGLFPKIGRRLKLTPMVHVSDAVSGILLAAENGNPGEIYLITDPQSQSFDTIRDIIRQALGIRVFIPYVPEWAALAAASAIEKTWSFLNKTPPVTRKNIESTLADRVFSIEKAKRELGFIPTVDPEIGLRDTVRWYRQKGWI